MVVCWTSSGGRSKSLRLGCRSPTNYCRYTHCRWAYPGPVGHHRPFRAATARAISLRGPHHSDRAFHCHGHDGLSAVEPDRGAEWRRIGDFLSLHADLGHVLSPAGIPFRLSDAKTVFGKGSIKGIDYLYLDRARSTASTASSWDCGRGNDPHTTCSLPLLPGVALALRFTKVSRNLQMRYVAPAAIVRTDGGAPRSCSEAITPP